MKILGVDFRDQTLQVSLVEVKFRTAVTLLKSEKVSIPHNREERNELIIDTLKKWGQDFSSKGVVIGLPLNYYLCHVIEMPSMNRNDLKNALLFELEKYLPLPVDEYIFDFTTRPVDKNRLKVLVFSIKKDIVYDYINLIKEAGLDILSIRCRAIEALSNVMSIAGDKKWEGLFINITDELYEVVGLKDSMPVFVKSFPGTAEMSYEIERLLALYPGQVSYLGRPDLIVPEQIESRKYDIQVSDALAVSGAKKSRIPLNYLPDEFIRKSKDYYPYVLGGFAAVAVLLYLLTGFVAYLKDLTALKSIESIIASIEDKASDELKDQKRLDMLKSDRKILLDFQNRSNRATKALSELSKVLPKDAWLIKISIDDTGKTELEGFATKTSGILAVLENSESFQNVTFSSPIIAKGGEERFSIKMEVEKH